MAVRVDVVKKVFRSFCIWLLLIPGTFIWSINVTTWVLGRSNRSCSTLATLSSSLGWSVTPTAMCRLLLCYVRFINFWCRRVPNIWILLLLCPCWAPYIRILLLLFFATQCENIFHRRWWIPELGRTHLRPLDRRRSLAGTACGRPSRTWRWLCELGVINQKLRSMMVLERNPASEVLKWFTRSHVGYRFRGICGIDICW